MKRINREVVNDHESSSPTGEKNRGEKVLMNTVRSDETLVSTQPVAFTVIVIMMYNTHTLTKELDLKST